MAPGNNPRIACVDHLKTLAIFLVVYGHSKATGVELGKLIYSFHMPLFFMLSGFLEGRSALALPFSGYIMKCAKQLLPAYLFFGTIGYLAWLLVLRHFGADVGLNVPVYYPLLAFLYGTGSGVHFRMEPVVLWFLPCLFVSRLILYAILRIRLVPFQLLASLGLLLVGCSALPRNTILPLELETAFVAQLFLLLGGYCKQINVFNWGLWNPVVKCVLGVVVLSTGLFCAQVNTLVDMRSSCYGNIAFFLAGAVLSCAGLALLFCQIRSSSVSQGIGRNTIWIFPLHPFIFSLLSAVYVYILHLEVSIRSEPVVGLLASVVITLTIPLAEPILRKAFPFVYGIGRRRA